MRKPAVLTIAPGELVTAANTGAPFPAAAGAALPCGVTPRG
jgi:hypothetical protein